MLADKLEFTLGIHIPEHLLLKMKTGYNFYPNKVNKNYITHTEFPALSGTSYHISSKSNAGDHNSAYPDNYWNVPSKTKWKQS